MKKVEDWTAARIMLVSWKELRMAECIPSKAILLIAVGNVAILWVTLKYWVMEYLRIKKGYHQLRWYPF
jgi:hypothetical protein